MGQTRPRAVEPEALVPGLVDHGEHLRGAVVQAGESLADPAAAAVPRGRALDGRQHRRAEQRMT
jgi:hypothetical protein